MRGAAADGGEVVAKMHVSLVPRQPGPGKREFRIDARGVGEKLLRRSQARRVVFVGECQRAKIKIVCARIGRWSGRNLAPFAGRHLRGQHRCNCARNVALDRQHVIKLSIVVLRPQMIVARCSDQLNVDADVVARFLDISFEHIGDAKFAGDCRNIRGAACELVG